MNETVEVVNKEENENSSKSKEIFETNENKCEVVDEVSTSTMETTEIAIKVPDIVTVYATATFENSPSRLTQDEVESLGRFITNKEHLKRNIADVQVDHFSSQEVRAGYFKHTVQIKISVRTAGLWEGARSYIWKHLGDDSWERGNGTRITLGRIHQKY